MMFMSNKGNMGMYTSSSAHVQLGGIHTLSVSWSGAQCALYTFCTPFCTLFQAQTLG